MSPVLLGKGGGIDAEVCSVRWESLSQETVAQAGHPTPRWEGMTFSEDQSGWGSGAPEWERPPLR